MGQRRAGQAPPPGLDPAVITPSVSADGTVKKKTQQQAASLPPFDTKEVQAWTNKDIADWLWNVGLEKYEKKFKEENVRGDVLFTIDADLLRKMGMKVGDIQRYKQAIEVLKDDKREQRKVLE